MNRRALDKFRVFFLRVIRTGRTARTLGAAVLVVAEMLVGVLANPIATYAAGSTPFNWVQLAPVSTPSSLMAPSMAYDPAMGTVLLFGGFNGSTLLNDTWTWNGSTWTQLSPATVPPARRNAAMVYDAATGDIVMFGGQGASGVLRDTWVWNGHDWSQLSPATSPPARENASIAYDAATGDVVLFGGWNGANALADTWLWNGTTWTQENVTGPGARYGGAMAYDPAMRAVLLFGGGNATTGGELADTWIWDGTSWSKQNPASSPSDRDSASMAYDPAAATMVLFGGYSASASGPVNDTWVWNGTDWSQASPSLSPSAREDAPMVYDPASHDLLLFGGEGTSSSVLGGTWGLAMNPPVLSSISPTSGPDGTSLTLTGSGFENPGTVAGSVYFIEGTVPPTVVPAGLSETDTSAQVTVPNSLVAGNVSVAVYNNTTGGFSAPLTFTVIGAPATMTESLLPSMVTAGGTVTVSGAVYDANGNPVSAVTVDVAVNGSAPVTVTTGTDGGYNTSLTAPTATGTVTVTATVANDTAVTHSQQLTVTAGPAKTIRATALPNSVVANGTSTSTVTATVTDASGNPVPNATVNFTTTLGTLATPAATTDPNGVATDTITSTTAGSATVTATANGVSGTTMIDFTIQTVFSPPSTLQPSLTQPSVSTPSSRVTTTTIGPQGGTIASSNKSLELEIPAGAFKTSTRVSVTQINPKKAPTSPTGFAAVAVLLITASNGAEPLVPVTLVYHVNAQALHGLSVNRLGIYLYDPSAKVWQWVGGVVNPMNDTVTVTLQHFRTYGVFVNQEQFIDLGKAPWARTAVDELLGAGIVTGVAKSKFDPEKTVTRAEFTKMLVLADGLMPVATGTLPFKDVPAGAWYAPYVRAAYQARLVSGESATRFDPNGQITRVQMAVMLSRLPGLVATAAKGLTIFVDSSKVPGWAVPGVEKALGASLVHGFPGEKFDPQGKTTRAQAALVIARYLRLIGKV